MDFKTALLGLFVVLTMIFASTALYEGTSRTTMTSTVTSATTTTITSLAEPGRFHRVTFNETTCNNDYADEWAVTFGGITISQPANATFPFSGRESFSPAGMAISKIVFTVPDGSYAYNASKSISAYVQSGTVDVNGSDVVVQIHDEPLSCGLGGGQG